MIKLTHLKPPQRLLLLLLFCDRGLYLLFRRRHLAIKYVESTLRLFGQPPRLFRIIEQTNVGAPRQVYNLLPVGRIVHELVESLLDIVMFACWRFAVLFAM